MLICSVHVAAVNTLSQVLRSLCVHLVRVNVKTLTPLIPTLFVKHFVH